MKRHAAAIFIIVFATIGCQAVPQSQTSMDNQETYDQDWEAQMEESGQEDLKEAYNQWVAAVKSSLEEEIGRKSG